ncbi:MFS general substrate transporter [Westerdykella ornata]|uniref:MFS general substrate transporter n=1 Tax=Westerdykella ornata TaxID=318751 RepID=A0A6A6JW64_WESOR|nr:MFS general substrate transporter [Westerdykella ornata]KAF2280647.1 MFS general substrate transporter [Westerdykella ornata]
MVERRLPVQQLVILSICRFAEPIALTSVFPYLPEMIEFFGVPENDIARWAGLTSAIFSLCQALTGIPWGAASDRFGRKPIILIGLFNTMVTMLVWGFSTSLPMAIAARAFSGLGSGNVGILRTTVAELCPWKELQPRAFSIMPLVYTIGAIIGPTLGGALSNPLRIDPRSPPGHRFLERYPYCLPNLVAAAIFCIGILVGLLFLEETLETKKNHRDYGLIIGSKITAWFRRTFHIPKQPRMHPEREPLLDPLKDDDERLLDDDPATTTHREGPPTIREVLSYQTTLNLVAYTFLALYTVAYDQLLPVFMHHPPQSLDDPNVSLPLKFAGGFGIGSRRIGAMFTVFAVTSTINQFFIFPSLARRLGVLRCLRIAFLIFPFIFFVTPFVSLLPGQKTKEVVMVVLLVIRGISGTFAFPTNTILLTNSAGSLRVLGTINGLATSVAAVGRAAGPAIVGNLFTFGVKHGYVIVPFWGLAIISILAAVPTWWLVEGKGFGDDPEPDEGDVLSSSALSISSEDGSKQATGIRDGALSESEYCEPTNPLSYTNTRSSEASASDDELDVEANETRDGHHSFAARRSSSGSRGLRHVRGHSHGGRSVTLRRRSSVPIGMGVGFQRLSSNLGSTGIGADGASWGGG